MSSKAGTSPLLSTGDGIGDQLTPSSLTAKSSAGVVQEPATFTLYTAQNSPRLGIHSTSMCHGYGSRLARSVATGSDQWMPSVDRRSSTVVAALVQPPGPLLTDHIIQSFGARRTTVGETMV